MKTTSPVDGSVFVERDLASPPEIERTLTTADAARAGWKKTSLEERARVLRGLAWGCCAGGFVSRRRVKP